MPSRRKARSRSRSRKRSVKLSSRKSGLKLLSVGRSPNKTKKYRAKFSDGTHRDFGAKGYGDYTSHKDPNRKDLYIKRHSRRENWKDMKSAGALSRYILWNKPSLRASIADFKRKFNH